MKFELSSVEAMDIVGALLDNARDSEIEGYLFTAKSYALLASRLVRGINEPHQSTMTDIVVETLDRISNKIEDD